MKKIFVKFAIIALSIATLATPIVTSAKSNENNLIEVQSSSYPKSVTRIYALSVYESGNLPRSVVVNEIKIGQYYSGRLSLVDFYINRNRQIEATYRGTMYPTNPGITPLQIKK